MAEQLPGPPSGPSASSFEWPPAAELLTLENEFLHIAMWPRMGGKFVSLRCLGRGESRELLHPPIHVYTTATRTSGFELSDAGGWDECLPSVAACSAEGVNVPDHGDVWRLPWQARIEDNAISASVDGFSLPLRFTRRVALDGPAIQLDYTAENIGEQPTAFLWSAHPLFQVDEGDRILLPREVDQVGVEYASAGEMSARSAWPHAHPRQSTPIDLSRVGAFDGKTAYKLFAGPLQSGICGIYRAKLQIGILFHFDPRAVPFAGLWISQGAWPESGTASRETRQYTVALEPTTAPLDSLKGAIEQGHGRHLAPGETFCWQLRLEIAGAAHPVSMDELLAAAAVNAPSTITI